MNCLVRRVVVLSLPKRALRFYSNETHRGYLLLFNTLLYYKFYNFIIYYLFVVWNQNFVEIGVDIWGKHHNQEIETIKQKHMA